MPKSQLDYYKEVQDDLVKLYNDRIIAVKDGKCIGDYQTRVDALRDMDKRGFKNGTYLIIRCTQGDSEYTAFFANNWIFWVGTAVNG